MAIHTLRYRLSQMELAGAFDTDSLARLTTHYGCDAHSARVLRLIENAIRSI